MLSQDEQWLLKEKYGGVESEGFHADKARLAAGEPLAHIIGWVPFLDCKIYLSDDSEFDPPIPSSRRHREFPSGDGTGIKAKQFALIPRSETEFWVEKAIAAIKTVTGPKILDLCAGSGCIGVAVAHHVPGSIVHFAEIDKSHLPTIGKNLSENQIACTDYRAWQSDIFSNIDEQYDFILCNPPYIDPKLDRTEASVKSYEPHNALYGGRDGMQLIEQIIIGAPDFLNAGGQLWLEHEPEQAAAIQVLAVENNFTVTTHIDQYANARFSTLMLQ